jgi:hypothetical protein
MCIAFDGAYILEAPATHPAATDECRPVPELTAGDADIDGAGRPVPLESAIR